MHRRGETQRSLDILAEIEASKEADCRARTRAAEARIRFSTDVMRHAEPQKQNLEISGNLNIKALPGTVPVKVVE
jgi:hypothetical protein